MSRRNEFARVIGVDVASLQLDINDSAGKIKPSLPNTVEFYQRLLWRGKEKKVALIAAMRKLLTILNDMVRRGQRWQETNKEATAAPSLN